MKTKTTTPAEALDLLALEERWCFADGHLADLAKHLGRVRLPHGGRFQAMVRRARTLVRKALWEASEQITVALGVLENQQPASIPF